MKLSIVTVNLNNFEGLKKTIASVVDQDYKDFEWIIIDGGSTDGSKELIAQYTDYITYWVSEQDRGIYNGMNKGIQASYGEYLLFLNSGDCLYNKEVLANVVPLLKDRDFYVGDIANGTMKLKIKDEKELCSFLTSFSLPHQATFTHRGVFKKYGMFREDILIASDWWLSFTALILGNASIEKIPLSIVVYDWCGISSVQSELLNLEREKLLSELPCVQCLCNFYRDNIKIVQALKASRLSFFVFRIYYYFYRHFF